MEPREVLKKGVAAVKATGMPAASTDKQKRLRLTGKELLEWAVTVAEHIAGRRLPDDVSRYVFDEKYFLGAFNNMVSEEVLEKDLVFLGGMAAKYGELLTTLAGTGPISIEIAEKVRAVMREGASDLCKDRGGYCEFTGP
jgi:hypothetical protein